MALHFELVSPEKLVFSGEVQQVDVPGLEGDFGVLAGHAPREAIGEYLRFMRYLADDETLSIDEKVAQSEQRTGYRNFALANFMRGFGNLEHPVEHTLGVYFHQCFPACSSLMPACFLPIAAPIR